MLGRSSGATRTVNNQADLLAWITAVRPSNTVIVVDDQLTEIAAVAALIKRIGNHSSTRVLPLRARANKTNALESMGRELETSGAVVVVGGGAVIDRVKIAVRSLEPLANQTLQLNQRSGMVLLPPQHRSSRPLAAVPTTVGTGAEVSKAGVLDEGHRRRFVIGEGVQPDLALHDAELLHTLAPNILHEGVLEIIGRILGPFVGDHRTLPVDDALAITCLKVALGLVPEVVAATAQGRKPDNSVLRSLQRVSTVSHNEAIAGSRPPYATRWWPVNNEVCSERAARKVPVLASVLPAVLTQVADGDSRWGSAERLEIAWGHAREQLPQLSSSAVQGIRDLVRWLDVTREPLDDLNVPSMADQICRAWGDGFPMLMGLDRGALEQVLESAVSESTRTDSPMPAGVGDRYQRRGGDEIGEKRNASR